MHSMIETGASLKAYPELLHLYMKIRLFFSPLIGYSYSVLCLLLLSGYCIGTVMSNWPCSKMAWAPYGRDGVEGVSSSSQRVFGSGRLEQYSAVKESSCCPPPPALCYARWRPLDLRTEKVHVNSETQHKMIKWTMHLSIFIVSWPLWLNWIAKNNVFKLIFFQWLDKAPKS